MGHVTPIKGDFTDLSSLCCVLILTTLASAVPEIWLVPTKI